MEWHLDPWLCINYPSINFFISSYKLISLSCTLSIWIWWSVEYELIDYTVHHMTTLLSVLDSLNFIKLCHMASSWCGMIFDDNGVSSTTTMIWNLRWHVYHGRDCFLSWSGFKYWIIIDLASIACTCWPWTETSPLTFLLGLSFWDAS